MCELRWQQYSEDEKVAQWLLPGPQHLSNKPNLTHSSHFVTKGVDIFLHFSTFEISASHFLKYVILAETDIWTESTNNKSRPIFIEPDSEWFRLSAKSQKRTIYRRPRLAMFAGSTWVLLWRNINRLPSSLNFIITAYGEHKFLEAIYIIREAQTSCPLGGYE